MMRCIENAIAGGFVTREQGEALQAQVSRMLREGLAPDDVKKRMAEDLEAAEKQRRRRALLQEGRRRILTEHVLSHRNARGENDPAEALWLILENFGQGKFDDLEHRRIGILGRAHADLEELLYEFRKGAFTGDFRRGRGETAASLDNVVRELFGQGTGDAKAAAIAKAWSGVAEKLRQRLNAAGGAVGKLDRWGLPQGHDPEALLTMGRTAWVDRLMRPGVLDRARMVDRDSGRPLGDEELREVLGDLWGEITSDGWMSREAGYAPYGKGALGKQRDAHHRFIHFANADEWLGYMRDANAGDPFEVMMGHLSVMARDIATMEILGPNPEAMRNYLKQLVLQHAAQVRPVQRVISDSRDVLAGTVARILPGDVGERFVAGVKSALDALADAELRLKAGGGDEKQLKAAAKTATDTLDALEKRLSVFEPARIGERRARLETDLARLDGERAAIRGKHAPQLKGLSKRAKGRLERLDAEEAVLRDELDLLEQADNSVMREEPEAFQDIIEAIAAARGEVQKLRTGGFRAVADPQNAARGAIARHDAMWDLIRGTNYAPVNSKWANRLQAARNIMTASLLGTASVTALSDINFQRAARKFAGMDKGTLAIIAGVVQHFAPSNRREAVRAGLLLDSAVHVMHRQARYVEGINPTTWSGFLADRVISASGLAAWTQAGKHAFGMAFQAELADRVGLAFAALPALVQDTLARHGITPKDWDVIRASQLYEPEPGATFLRPNEIAQGAGGEALAERYLSMIHRETRHAVIEGTVRTRTIFGGSRPGTFVGEVIRNMAQFKTFGVAVAILHGGRIAREWQRGAKGRAVGTAAGLMTTGVILGAIVNELYEVLNGRDPVLPQTLARGEVPGGDYWGAALLKSGGLGIYGDFLFAPVNWAGQGLASVFSGPVGQQIERVRTRGFKEVQEFFDDDDVSEGRLARGAIATARELMPGGTLWYLRLMKERLVFNQLQLAFDPNAEKVLRRHAQLQQKRKGNEYWWRPGDVEPYRWPRLGAGDAKLPSLKAGARPAVADRSGGAKAGERIVQSKSRRFQVLDGDTVEVDGRRFRLAGIDAPEVYSKAKPGERQAGVRSALRLQELLLDGQAELEVTDGPDAWGRGRARLTINGRDAGDILTGEGLARRDKPDPRREDRPAAR